MSKENSLFLKYRKDVSKKITQQSQNCCVFLFALINRFIPEGILDNQ